MSCPIKLSPSSIAALAAAICECFDELEMNTDQLEQLLTDLTAGFTNGDFTVDIGNWDGMPIGIEAALAPMACTKNAAGDITGKIFVCKEQVDETGGAVTFGLKWTDGSTPTARAQPSPAEPAAELQLLPDVAAVTGVPTPAHQWCDCNASTANTGVPAL